MTGTVAPAKAVLQRIRSDARVVQFRQVEQSGKLPYFRPAASPVAPLVRLEGRDRIMLGSANYLGLGNHPAVLKGAREALDAYGSTITGSRLLNGTIGLHRELEDEIAEWTGEEAALVFTTGYQTNVGTISALVGPGDTLVVDEANHASLLDGCRLSGAKVRAFKHNRMNLLRDALERASRDGGATMVVVDGVYSMEGDVAHLTEIVPLCEEYRATLMVDEAHGVGCVGARGTGVTETFGVEGQVDVRMGSLSKALGATGGFIAGGRDLVDYLRVSARAFLFTTSAVPAAIGAALAGIRVCRSEEGRDLAGRLMDNTIRLRKGLEERGFDVVHLTRGVDAPIVTPIVPVVAGDDAVALDWWAKLYELDVFSSVALYPAVRAGRALLRLCPMATHRSEHIDRALEAFRTLTPAS